MKSQPQNPEFRNNPEKLSPMHLFWFLLEASQYASNEHSQLVVQQENQ